MLEDKSKTQKASCNFNNLAHNIKAHTSAAQPLGKQDAYFTATFLLTIIYTLKRYCLCMKRTILFSSK